MPADRLVFRHRTFYDEHRIELKLGPAGRAALDAAATAGWSWRTGEKLTL